MKIFITFLLLLNISWPPNIHDSWLAEADSVLNCKLGRVPFLYLGLPIGGDPRKLNFGNR